MILCAEAEAPSSFGMHVRMYVQISVCMMCMSVCENECVCVPLGAPLDWSIAVQQTMSSRMSLPDLKSVS